MSTLWIPPLEQPTHMTIYTSGGTRNIIKSWSNGDFEHSKLDTDNREYDTMSYIDALKAAGATVHEFGQFGYYSGMWLAKVTYNGETGFIQGWWGSCTMCDAFQGEFDYGADSESDEEYQKRLADFGKNYLEALLPDEHYIKMFSREFRSTKDLPLSEEEEEALDWLQMLRDEEYRTANGAQ